MSEEGRREAIIFVLKKLRRMTLEGFKFGREYYDFEFYRMEFEEAEKSPEVMHEVDALRYLDQKGVINFTEGDEVDESVVSDLNEQMFQQELARFGLVDNGTSIRDGVPAVGKSYKRPVFNRDTGEIIFRGKRLLLSPSTKQYYVAKACLAKWGKQIPELDIIDDLLANSFDANERVVRDSVPRLNRKFNEIFKVENAFRYSGGHVSIDPLQFETV